MKKKEKYLDNSFAKSGRVMNKLWFTLETNDHNRFSGGYFQDRSKRRLIILWKKLNPGKWWVKKR